MRAAKLVGLSVVGGLGLYAAVVVVTWAGALLKAVLDEVEFALTDDEF